MVVGGSLNVNVSVFNAVTNSFVPRTLFAIGGTVRGDNLPVVQHRRRATTIFSYSSDSTVRIHPRNPYDTQHRPYTVTIHTWNLIAAESTVGVVIRLLFVRIEKIPTLQYHDVSGATGRTAANGHRATVLLQGSRHPRPRRRRSRRMAVQTTALAQSHRWAYPVPPPIRVFSSMS